MASVLYLSDGTTTVYLNQSNFYLRDGVYDFKTDAEPFWEVFELAQRGLSGGTIRTQLSNLETLFQRAREFVRNPLHPDAVWLYHSADGESTRRAVVLDGELMYESLRGRNPFLTPTAGGGRAKISVLRLPVFEDSSAWTYGSGTQTLWNWSGLIGNAKGTFPARIAKMDYLVAGGAHRQWVGIRPLYEGTTDFDPVLECEDGQAWTDTVVQGGIGAASGGQTMKTTWATAGMNRRFKLTIDQIIGAGSPEHYLGRYLVLMRLKTSSANEELSIQFRAGLEESDAGYPPIISTFYHKGTGDWDLLELGEISIPGGGVQNPDLTLSELCNSVNLEIWAEELVDNGGFCHWDAFVLVPTYSLFYSGAGAYTTGQATVGTSPIDTYFGYVDWYAATVKYRTMPFSVNEGWSYPQEGGLLVFAATLDIHSLTLTGDVDIKAYPRWRFYRDD